MQVTIAQERCVITVPVLTVPAKERAEAVDLNCARVHSLCSPKGEQLVLRRKFFHGPGRRGDSVGSLYAVVVKNADAITKS